MSYNSLEEICEICKAEEIPFDEAILRDSCEEMELPRERILSRMEQMWTRMQEAKQAYDRNLASRSGLVGGLGGKMEDYRLSGRSFCDDFSLRVMEIALKMGESNACMKRIVAAPTAGSCGVLPAVLLAAKDSGQITDEEAVKALLTAAGIGQIIAQRASVSGAFGGCQAEVGAAAAMTAGALVSIRVSEPEKIGHAVAMSVKNMLGLVCDPVGGLVEVPCVKRNVAGAMIALSSAEMALAGIESVIPADQMIDVMKDVGEDMHSRYKETACGGCAVTPRGMQIAERMKQDVRDD